MTMSVANIAEDASPMRGLLPLWVGVLIYALFLVAGNRLLIDPDTMWQITVGQWIIGPSRGARDRRLFLHHARPALDLDAVAGAGALRQGLRDMRAGAGRWCWPRQRSRRRSRCYARFLSRRLSESTTLVFVAAALALTVPHLLARPHVLALPVMVAWVGGLIAAADRRGAPSFWLLPLMALWANLHGGFVFGLVLIAPIALDAVLNADVKSRKALALRWAAFAVAALVSSCCTPYGWNSLLASQKILALGAALPLIMEWQPTDFGSVGAFEVCLLLGSGLRCFAASSCRRCASCCCSDCCTWRSRKGAAVEILALLAPLILAAPLARQIGGDEASTSSAARADARRAVRRRRDRAGGGNVCLCVRASLRAAHRGSPVAAVVELKKLNLTRVFNDYDFGGYLIANGVATFIDGRTELFGEKFFVDHNAASGLMEPENLFRLLDEYSIEATLMRTQSAATKLLDHIDGWQKIYTDDIATHPSAQARCGAYGRAGG